MTEALAHGYSSDHAHWKLSNEYQHDRVYMVFKNRCVIVVRMKVAMEGLLTRDMNGLNNLATDS